MGAHGAHDLYIYIYIYPMYPLTLIPLGVYHFPILWPGEGKRVVLGAHC